MIIKGLLFVLFALVTVEAHRYMRPSITKLEEKVEALENENNQIYEALDFLESNLTSQIKSCASGGQANTGGSQITPKAGKMSADFEERLKALEERIHAIKNYLSGEKKNDNALREESSKVIDVMEGKVKETDQVINELRTNVENTLEDFGEKIAEVEVVANVIVNSEGTVMYGQVGSACTEYGQECADDLSECRSGRCQCVKGLSYNIQQRKCIDSCQSYGNTYQTFNRWIIYGFNDLSLNETNLAECKKTCETDESFECRSFDYFPQFKQCFLSHNVVTEVPEDMWQYNTEGIHFQRDCAKRTINLA